MHRKLKEKKGRQTCKALITCSGAIVFFSSRLHTSLDSEDRRLMNSEYVKKYPYKRLDQIQPLHLLLDDTKK
jgi:hypothetical protein